MKNIKITYVKIDDNTDNCLAEISLEAPEYNDIRHCYVRELFYFPTIKEKILNREEEYARHDIIFDITEPFYLKISDEVYQEIEEYLDNPTEFDIAKWNDDVTLLQAVLSLYRNDPKMWSVD